MEISDWLRGLGLEQYEAAFRDNEITAELLASLTAEDLKDLGVTIIGHRRRMLNDIAALKGEGGLEAQVPLPKPTMPVAGDLLASKRVEAERRQLTVVFCDLVGSTALATRLDPEDLRHVIGAYHNCVTETVGRFQGFVAKYMGDGVLLYFGYPQAHEDDAAQAVRAGLALVDAVVKIDPVALQVRIGIATGMVVVGDLIGRGAAQEQAVVGETPNLAARLQALAEPGTVVIAASTRRLTGGHFEYRDLGSIPVKGLPAPTPTA